MAGLSIVPPFFLLLLFFLTSLVSLLRRLGYADKYKLRDRIFLLYWLVESRGGTTGKILSDLRLCTRFWTFFHKIKISPIAFDPLK